MGKDSYMETGVRIDGSGDVSIGEHCFLSHNVKILTHTHDRLKGRVANIHEEMGRKTFSVKIGNNVFIGEDAVILPQAGEIGDDAVIGVRAVVTKPVGAGEIWAGNPARKVGSRYDEDTDGTK
jgi:acetyltransferase-like isoleucine patch superfamily enzyme